MWLKLDHFFIFIRKLHWKLDLQLIVYEALKIYFEQDLLQNSCSLIQHIWKFHAKTYMPCKKRYRIKIPHTHECLSWLKNTSNYLRNFYCEYFSYYLNDKYSTTGNSSNNKYKNTLYLINILISMFPITMVLKWLKNKSHQLII